VEMWSSAPFGRQSHQGSAAINSANSLRSMVLAGIPDDDRPRFACHQHRRDHQSCEPVNGLTEELALGLSRTEQPRQALGKRAAVPAGVGKCSGAFKQLTMLLDCYLAPIGSRKQSAFFRAFQSSRGCIMSWHRVPLIMLPGLLLIGVLRSCPGQRSPSSRSSSRPRADRPAARRKAARGDTGGF